VAAFVTENLSLVPRRQLCSMQATASKMLNYTRITSWN